MVMDFKNESSRVEQAYRRHTGGILPGDGYNQSVDVFTTPTFCTEYENSRILTDEQRIYFCKEIDVL